MHVHAIMDLYGEYEAVGGVSWYMLSSKVHFQRCKQSHGLVECTHTLFRSCLIHFMVTQCGNSMLLKGTLHILYSKEGVTCTQGEPLSMLAVLPLLKATLEMAPMLVC